MHLKCFRGASVRDTLRIVRETLGPDAYVLSTRTVRRAGLTGWFSAKEIEITAAAERLPVSETRTQADPSTAMVARLQASGLDSAIARAVAGAIPARLKRGASSGDMADALAGQLAGAVAHDTKFAPVEVFVGPPGAGKTTTIAKIAAQERARRGKKLSLLAADGFRVGAVEQLRIFADIIGAPFLVARSADEVLDTLDDGARPMLMDTAGRSPRDDSSRQIFRVLARRRDVRTHLVIPAGSSVDAARRIIETFEDARPSRLVLTKCDEAGSLAPLLGVAAECDLPISYLGTGQSVPEDLYRATPAIVASWALGEGAQAGAFA
jgi:flagellar biosynthesis protein FlhF